MPIDNFNPNGPTSSSKSDKRSANLYPHPVVAVVKNNTDSIRSGSMWVYVLEQGAEDSDDKNSWVQVRYSSPFYGTTRPVATGSEFGEFVGNSHSYGFWATAPDVGTKVLCVFVNGSANFGYYIGCIPEPEKLQMVPAIGAASAVTVNPGEGKSYGATERLPVTNINTTNEKLSDSSTFLKEAKPVHSYAAAILNKQGLLRDRHRGVIGSSAQRESPSRVIGISTPGRPIYDGGFTDQSVTEAIKNNADATKFKVIGRRGGHSLVLDDGDIVGDDQLIRIRTALGHQIMMNDTSQSLTIIHSNGQSWVELGAEGTVDVYSSNSVNIRTQGDLNLHADRDINMHAGRKMNFKAEDITLNSDKTLNFRSSMDTTFYSQGKFGVVVDSSLSLLSSGEASLKSESTTFINGSRINLETGTASFVPKKLNPIDTVLHADTSYDPVKGYLAVPGKLESITSRAPAHFPWESVGTGVDVKVDLAEPAVSLSPAVSSINTPAEVPDQKTSTSVLATVPVTSKVDPVKSAIVSQTAVAAATGIAKDAVTNGAAIVTDLAGVKTVAVGVLGSTVEQLASSASGVLKPGADAAIKAAISAGKTVEQAMSSAFFTGTNGIKSVADFTKNTVGQVANLNKMIDGSVSDLTKMQILKGGEKLNAIAGIATAAAVVGPKNIASLIKNPAGLASLSNKIAKAAAAGAFASKLAGTLRGGFPSVDKIAAMIPSLTPGKALDLIKEKANSALNGAISGVTSQINGAISGVTSKINSVAELASKIKNKQLPSLDNLLNKVSLGLPGGMKIASIATATQSLGKVIEQSKQLLGNAKIPAIPFTAPTSEELQTSRDALSEKLKLSDEYAQILKQQQEAKALLEKNIATFGRSSSQALTSLSEFSSKLSQAKDILGKITPPK